MAEREVIARGARSEIIAWAPGKVLKLYEKGRTAAFVGGEAEATRQVRDLGIPAPEIYGTLEVDGRHGIIMERIDGPSMVDALRADGSQYGQLARILAEVQAAVHAHEVPQASPLQKELRRRINSPHSPLAAELKARATVALEGLPEGQALCHGDLHGMNIILSPGRGPVIIDWDSPTAGNPLADVARTLLICLASRWHVPAEQFDQAKMLTGRLAFVYLRRYFALRPVCRARRADLRTWLWINAAARLSEGIAVEERWLADMVREGHARDTR
jgi:thiamine kinase